VTPTARVAWRMHDHAAKRLIRLWPRAGARALSCRKSCTHSTHVHARGWKCVRPLTGASSADITVADNLLAGGGFTVYAEDYSPSEASPAGGYTVTGVTFTNNRFSNVHYGCVGGFGVWFPRGAPSDGWRRSGNTVLETGQNVDAGNPTSGGRTCN
jgi:CubicO group peptidase (beta-lactamase class C family)